MKLYKYRTLDNWKRFIDILVNQRLYAAEFDKLNDPMEGCNLHGETDGEATKEALRSEKGNWRVLALYERHDNLLLWSHYSSGHTGAALEVEPQLNEAQHLFPVDYVDSLGMEIRGVGTL